jgi:hypothetical protein
VKSWVNDTALFLKFFSQKSKRNKHMTLPFYAKWEQESSVIKKTKKTGGLLGTDKIFLLQECHAGRGTSEPIFVDLLRSQGIDSQPGGPVRQPYLSYRAARLQRLAESIPRNRFWLHKRLQIRALVRGVVLWEGCHLLPLSECVQDLHSPWTKEL